MNGRVVQPDVRPARRLLNQTTKKGDHIGSRHRLPERFPHQFRLFANTPARRHVPDATWGNSFASSRPGSSPNGSADSGLTRVRRKNITSNLLRRHALHDVTDRTAFSQVTRMLDLLCVDVNANKDLSNPLHHAVPFPIPQDVCALPIVRSCVLHSFSDTPC